MTCAEIKDRTIDYLYGELSAGERAAFDQHLAGCDGCRAEVGGLQGTLHQARAAVKMTDEAPPARVRVAVLEAARAAAGGASVPVAAAARAVPVRGRTEIKAEGGGFWEWLKRPWVFPLVGAGAAAVIFLVVGRDVVTNPAKDLARTMAPEPPPAAPVATAPAAQEEMKPEGAAEGEAPADLKARPAASAPARKGIAGGKREQPVANKVANVGRAEADSERGDRRRFAPPPPPRVAVRAPAAHDKVDELLDGAMRGADRQKEGSGAGAVGHLGGPGSVATRSQPAPAEKKQVAGVERHRPPQELAKSAPAPVAMEPRPAPAPASPPPARPSQGRAAYSEDEPLAAAAPAPAEEVALSRDDRAPAKAKKAGPSPFEEQVRKADRLFTDAHWGAAAAAYRELLRQYPQNSLVAAWKGRLRACEQALAPPPAAAAPAAASSKARK